MNQKVEHCTACGTLMPMAQAVRFEFECGCRYTAWAEGGWLKSGLSCCALHEASSQTLGNILQKCPMLLVGVHGVREADADAADVRERDRDGNPVAHNDPRYFTTTSAAIEAAKVQALREQGR